MARAPLLQLSDLSLAFVGRPLFDGLDAVVRGGDRVALVGRNGSGKSTLLKVMAGVCEPDRGARTVAPGASIGYLEQDPDLSGFATLGDYAASDLDPSERYKAESVAEGLKLDLAIDAAIASGGQRRRAALAKLMADAPDLMLVDEPTNHLDIEAIGWLERRLAETRAAFVLITHDRAFARALTRATLWIDRGQVRRLEEGFGRFEAWRDKLWAEEDEARHKLDRKIKAEARWAVEGITARRKRNMGRVRALEALRKERASQIKRQGVADFALDAGAKSGKGVIEARGVAKSFGERVIVKDFDFRALRGDRVALVGPNGVGKTTLLKLLTGALAPDAGAVTLGTNLEIALFDQQRDQLAPDASLWDSLAGDPLLSVAGKSDQVMVRGVPRHVVGYLRDFLFDERQARAPVRSLSGGEKARLLLARIMARQSNLLVLDEPTNDLDIETLDLLQDVLAAYEGTVLLVSHDRDFLDRVATTTIAMRAGGAVAVYAGGWSDYRAQAGGADDAPAPAKKARAAAKPAREAKAPTGSTSGLSFTERHRLEKLPKLIEKLEAEIAKLNGLMADPDLFQKDPERFEKASSALAERQALLADAEEEWLALAERDQ